MDCRIDKWVWLIIIDAINVKRFGRIWCPIWSEDLMAPDPDLLPTTVEAKHLESKGGDTSGLVKLETRVVASLWDMDKRRKVE